ncbi:tellurite resistance protein TehA-like permease [Streptomyces sp. V4I8]|uniref:tellurite resistance/C4-dicarboxylate transporter family protein n=1 Tax=Streptomyces sp. V4I8 TaxID=3156469 RepID=UPI0035121A54
MPPATTTPTPTSPLLTWWSQRPPAAGAAVMATGILSVALNQTDHETLSRIALALACASWLALAGDFTARLLWDRARWVNEAATPAALTAIAATTVLGTRFTTLGWEPLAKTLLALAALLWPGFLIAVVRHWHPRMSGAVFLGCVATQGLAVLGATLAANESSAWLAHAALVLFWLGLVLYVIALTRFDLRQVVHGAGDHWVAGGALAISALAGSKLIAADSTRLYLWNDDDTSALRKVTVALLILDLAWYAALALAEIARPRLRYDVRRWATVFPMGMTAAATLSVATALDVPWLETPGEVLLWITVAAWLAVSAGALWAYTHPGHSSVSGADATPGATPGTDVTSTTRR